MSIWKITHLNELDISPVKKSTFSIGTHSKSALGRQEKPKEVENFITKKLFSDLKVGEEEYFQNNIPTETQSKVANGLDYLVKCMNEG